MRDLEPLHFRLWLFFKLKVGAVAAYSVNHLSVICCFVQATSTGSQVNRFSLRSGLEILSSSRCALFHYLFHLPICILASVVSVEMYSFLLAPRTEVFPLHDDS